MVRNYLVYKEIYSLTRKASIKLVCSAVRPIDCESKVKRPIDCESKVKRKCRCKRTFPIIHSFNHSFIHTVFFGKTFLNFCELSLPPLPALVNWQKSRESKMN